MYQHKFTWLKVAAVIYITELVTFFILSGTEIRTLTDAGFYILPLIAVLFGIVIGFAINLVFRYRWTVSSYIAGHVLLFAGLLVFAKLDYYFFGNPSEPINYKRDFSNLREDIEPALGDAFYNTTEKVLFDMEEKYPLGGYKWNLFISEFVNKDTTGNSGVFCYIVFSLPEEGDNTYISKYYVNGDSLSEVYGKKDTNSMEYWKFRRSTARYDTLFTQ